MEKETAKMTNTAKKIFILVLILGSNAFAKRPAPAKIDPIEEDGKRYSVVRESAKDLYSEFIICQDMSSFKEVWKTKIYEKHINPKLEFDVQDIYLKSFEESHDQLKAIDEKGTIYSIQISDGKLLKPRYFKVY